MHSIRAKLMVAILAALIVIFLVSTILNVYQVNNALQSQIDRSGDTLVKERSHQFNQWITIRRAELQHLASLSQIIYLDPEDSYSRTQFLNDQRRQFYDYYETLFFADVKGDTQLSPASYFNVSSTDYFQTAIGGTNVLSKPFQSDITQGFVVALAVPVRDEARNVIGVLAGYIHLERLGQLAFGNLQDPVANTLAFIVDGDGTMIVHPNSNFIYNVNIKLTEEIKGIAAIADTILTQSSGQTQYDGENGEEFVYFSRIPGTGGWSLVYTVSGENLAAPLRATTNWLVISNILAVAVVAVVIVLVAGAITRPLREMVTVLSEVATGDLTQKVDSISQDEVGQTARFANVMAESLANIIRELKKISNTIVSSGQQIAASIVESTTGLEQSSILATEIGSNMQLNAASVDQTKNSAQHVASSAQLVSELTSEAARECATAVHQATTGSQAVADVAHAMGEISMSSEQVNQLVENLIDSTQRIEEMLELITQISEQTNLLSLNAAIEAARAGEMGQGFAVVASEVRKLATRSTHAVEEIAQLVDDIRRKVDITSQAVGQSNTIIHQAEERSRVTMETIQSMVTSINNVEQKISSVTEAASEQAVNSNAIREAVANIAASTQETSAGAEELGATLEEQVAILANIEITVAELTGMVQRLDQMMGHFTVLDD